MVSENDQGEDGGVKTDGKKSNDDKQKHHSVLLQVKKTSSYNVLSSSLFHFIILSFML